MNSNPRPRPATRGNFAPVSFIAIAVLFAGCAHQAATEPVSLSITAPDKISAPAQSAEIIFPLQLKLKNNRDEKIQLQAGTPCAVFRWQITDAAGNVIQRNPNQLCIQMMAIRELAARAEIIRGPAIALRPELYRAGATYRLHCQFWGYRAEHEFVLRP